MKTKDVILFQIADVEYGMGIQYVQGVETYVKIVPISNTDECIEGIVDIRGDIIPIFNLRKKFELAEVPVTEDTKFLVVKLEGGPVGFKVDFVTGMRSIPESDIYDVPLIVGTEKTSYLDFIIRREGHLAVILKPDKLLDELEKKKIKEALNEYPHEKR